MHFITLLSLTFATQEIDPFLDKEVKIMFSAYSHIHLSELSDGTIGGFNRYLSPKQFLYDDNAKISKNGDGYEIQIGGSKICQIGNKVGRCKDSPNVWYFDKRTFGFNIRLGGKCITQKEYDKLEMQRCNDDNDKIFALKLSSQKNDCEELKEKNASKPKMPKINVITVNDSSDNDSVEIDDKWKSDSHISSSDTESDHKKDVLIPKHGKKVKLQLKKKRHHKLKGYHESRESNSDQENIRKGYDDVNEFLNLS